MTGNKWKNRITKAAVDPERRRHHRHKGNAPDKAQQPLTLAELTDADDNTTWRLALLRATIAGEALDDDWWINLKLYALQPALYKGNFWLSWCGGPEAKHRRVKKWLDAGALEVLRPKLMGAVRAYLTYVSEPARWASLLNLPLMYVQSGVGDSYTLTEDRDYAALAFDEPRTFTQADLPRIKELGKLVQAERGRAGWSMVPDELSGGFTLRVKK